MTQEIINTGTLPNDGTGDVLRTAVLKTQNNFVELYTHHGNTTANIVVLRVAANTWANTVGRSGNAYCNVVGTAGNTYTNVIAVSVNAYANVIGLSGNAYANLVGISGNTYANLVAESANNYAGSMANSVNAYANVVGISGNTYANLIGDSANNYAGAMTNSANAYAAATYLPYSGGTITNDLIVSGNLTISGMTTYANTQTLLVGDAIFIINSDMPASSAPSENAGLEVNRGSSANVSIIWNEASDTWTLTNDGTVYYDIATNNYVNVSTLSANNYAGSMSNSVNSYANTVGTSGNAYANVVGLSSNNWANTVGVSGNAYANVVGVSGNAYANIIGDSANNYAGFMVNTSTESANNYAGSMANSVNVWSLSTFTTLSNTSTLFDVANAAFNYANIISFYANSDNVIILISEAQGYANDAVNTSIQAFQASNLAHDKANAAFEGANSRYIILTNSSITLDGATGNIWGGSFSTPLKNTWSGFYNSNNDTALFTFASGAGSVMSVQMDGSLFVGDNFISDALGVLPSYGGWIVASSGIKSVYNISAGVDIQAGANVLAGNVISSGYIQFSDGSKQYTANAPSLVSSAAFDKANAANVLAFNTGIGANNYAGVMANAANAYAASLTPNLSPVFVVANAAFDKANAANVLAFNTGIGANNYAGAMANSGNAYTVVVGAASNAWSNTVGVSGNAYAVVVGAASNTWANTVGSSGNAYTVVVGAASNTWANTVGIRANTWANTVGSSGNAYTVVVGAASNTWANSVGVNANTYANATFATITNASAGYAVANAAFDKANTGGLTVGTETLSSCTFYIMLSSTTTGTISTANVSPAELEFVPSTGTLSATQFNSLSDISLKTDVTEFDGPSLIQQIHPVTFTWRDTTRQSYGVIAQELEQIMPELVETNDKGIKSVSYIPMIALLIDTNKKLIDRVSSLENEIEEIKKKL